MLRNAPLEGGPESLRGQNAPAAGKETDYKLNEVGSKPGGDRKCAPRPHRTHLPTRGSNEQDFLPCSFGYRPKLGPLDAVKDITDTLFWGKYTYIVEADIKGFYDNIDHDWMIRMLDQRIDDKAFVNLIRKWLKAGVLDTDGMVIHPAAGTPL